MHSKGWVKTSCPGCEVNVPPHLHSLLVEGCSASGIESGCHHSRGKAENKWERKTSQNFWSHMFNTNASVNWHLEPTLLKVRWRLDAINLDLIQYYRPGGHLYFRMDIILVKGLKKKKKKKHLNTYFSGMKIDLKYVFLHVVFLICLSCSFQNLSLWRKAHPFFHFFTPKRCTRVHCLVLKNNPNYVNFFMRMISNFKNKCPP